MRNLTELINSIPDVILEYRRILVIQDKLKNIQIQIEKLETLEIRPPIIVLDAMQQEVDKLVDELRKAQTGVEL